MKIVKWIKSEKFLVIIGGLLVFSFYALITLNLNIHGDSKFHTQFAKESVESGFLVKNQPYRIYSISNGQISFEPISYPLGSEALFGSLYAIGGETLLQLLSAIMALGVYLLVYVLLREFGKKVALPTAILSVLVVGERLFMTPLLEPLLLILLLGAVVCVKNFLRQNDKKQLYLAALFVGAATCIKQQGLVALFAIAGFLTCFFVWKIAHKEWGLRKISALFIFILIAFTVPAPSIAEQIHRTGTFAFAPGRTELPSSMPFYNLVQPLLTSKFAVKPEAKAAIKEQVKYNQKKQSFTDKVRGFLLAPILFYRSTDSGFLSSSYTMLFYGTLTLLLLFVIALIRRGDVFGGFLVYLMITEMLVSFTLKTPITQYHTFGVILVVMVLALALKNLLALAKVPGIAYLLLAFGLFTFNYADLLVPLWSSSGREDGHSLTAYQRIGAYVQESTPKSSIFLAPETSFRYYAKRDTIWLTEDNADVVMRIITNPNPDNELKDLRSLSVTHVVINASQLNRYGVNDYLPPDGLYAGIKNSPHFKKLYDPYGDGHFVIYEVRYE
ncbi:MAG: hypothetical protein JWN01_599 [Patescibacteria group bacterium]|nr:hypothetical protein [Patescibacteria group bacterium]